MAAPAPAEQAPVPTSSVAVRPNLGAIERPDLAGIVSNSAGPMGTSLVAAAPEQPVRELVNS
jgi:hypothetical protein